jgi:hypothetical protein
MVSNGLFDFILRDPARMAQGLCVVTSVINPDLIKKYSLEQVVGTRIFAESRNMCNVTDNIIYDNLITQGLEVGQALIGDLPQKDIDFIEARLHTREDHFKHEMHKGFQKDVGLCMEYLQEHYPVIYQAYVSHETVCFVEDNE